MLTKREIIMNEISEQENEEEDEDFKTSSYDSSESIEETKETFNPLASLASALKVRFQKRKTLPENDELLMTRFKTE
jgi:hypothetical protein